MSSPSTQKPTPPGSLGLPFIGETLSYVRDNHRFFEERFARLGPVFKTRLFGETTVCFAGPDAFEFFMSAPHFTREGANPRQIQELLHWESLPLLDGAEHRRRKGVVLQAFRAEALELYLPVIERMTLDFMERWQALESFAWLPEFKKLNSSLCSALFLGAGPEEDMGPTIEAFVGGLTAFPINIPWTQYGRALGARDRLLARIGEAIRSGGDDGAQHILGELMSATTEDGARLSEEEIRNETLHLFFAAYGSIYVLLTLMCLNLACNPDAMERSRAEIGDIAPQGPLSAQQLAKLTYLGQLSQEVRRSNRINSSTFLAKVKEPFEYNGFRVPSGWKAVGCIYVTLQDTDVFSRPERFDPDRFGPERAEDRRHHYAYVPHGGGPADGHRCPGEDLMSVLMKVVSVLLLRRYTWELLPQNLELDTSLFPLPRDGLKVRLMSTESS